MRCVFLDLGKVLLNFDHGILGDRLQSLTAAGMEDIRAAFSSKELAVRYETGRMSDAEFHREVCARIGKEIAFDDFVSAWNSIFDPVPLVSESLLERISARAALWVISNTNPLHFAHLRRYFPILGFFRGYVLSHEVGALKPDRKIFVAALERSGFAAHESLFVDDQIANVRAALELGFDAFQFVDEDQLRSEFEVRMLI